MGFFSSDCEGCGHPLLSQMATETVNAWMNLGVAIKRDGSILKGAYDGYGQLGNYDYAIEDATVWHQACWAAAGSPTDYRGESKPSADQGWFFADGTHDMTEPASAGG
ncbi:MULTISPECIES: hypothetical protein [Mycolicibacter]|uniref:Uncharacterized protein n=1 Tax=Mycolicibacter longobardus TaxID=1108812 RepID=A0A1X1YAJ9_9MYCO|nr:MULTISPECIES: hypothetical protein [Mycolicibacter]ORW08133.1 hypothetical protein AWC16_20615 [Mycolicibacter longobardus]RAV04241.1 hypothetical protein DQP56_00010 [Mycolicibacter senuensis]